MAITNYGELKSAVANWLERDDLTARIPEFIELAEHRLAKSLRVREMETSTTTAMVVGQKNYTLPTGYLQFRRLFIDQTPAIRLEYRSPYSYWSIYANLPNATPEVFTIEGEEFYLGAPPDTTDNVQMLYYAKLDTITKGDTDTNDVLTNSAGLYLYGALIESAPFLGDDPRLLVWSQLWEDLLERTNQADANDRASGDPDI